MDIYPAHETSYITQYQEVFLKYEDNKDCANYRCQFQNKPNQVWSNNLFPSATVSISGQSSLSIHNVPRCKDTYPCARQHGLTYGNCVHMVANVDSSDYRCRCIGKIIARDLRLVASRLSTSVVTQPGTHHVHPCHYIIHLSRCRPPGLHNPLQEDRKEMEQKQSNDCSMYAIVRTHKSHNRSAPLKATFHVIRYTGKLHLRLTEIEMW
jgi:hypothetical protein